MHNILLVDFGSTYTKVTIVDLAKETITASARAPTSIHTDIMDGLNAALYLIDTDTKLSDFNQIFAASSAGGGLRIVASGLVPELTATAAKMAALNAGGKVIKTFSYELTNFDIAEIIAISPDILLLTGGTDGGNKSMVMHNVMQIVNADFSSNLLANITIVVACNRAMSQHAADLIGDSGKKVVLTQNVMPKLEVLNIDPAREVIRDIFLEDIVKAKGLSSVQDLIDGILMPTPSAVMLAIELLSNGYTDDAGSEEGLGAILAIDVGGATTDIYSAIEGKPFDTSILLKGFSEPYIKRTVEGDLGLRFNADNIVSETGINTIAALSNLNVDQINAMLMSFKKDPSILPINKDLRDFDIALGMQAVKLGVKRHAGVLEIVYTIDGANHIQTGKDLAKIKYVIGTGGPIINSPDARAVLQKAVFELDDPLSLRPRDPKFMLDQAYMLSAMGLLATHHPKIALKIMKKYLIEI